MSEEQKPNPNLVWAATIPEIARELAAMEMIWGLLMALNTKQRARVLQWLDHTMGG